MTADRAPPPTPAPEPLFTTGPLRWRAAVRRHRRAGPSRVASVLTGLVLLVAVVAAGGAIADSRIDTANERFREFVTTGAVGEPVAARGFEVTVREVRTAAVVSDGILGGPRDTGGVWVLVRVRAVAVREPVSIGYAAVRDSGGRTWLASQRVDQPLGGAFYRLEPGIPVEGDFVFEVPADAATDLTLRLARNSATAFLSTGLQLETVAEVALPVDEAQVARALAEPAEVELADPRVVLPGPRALPGAEDGRDG